MEYKALELWSLQNRYVSFIVHNISIECILWDGIVTAEYLNKFSWDLYGSTKKISPSLLATTNNAGVPIMYQLKVVNTSHKHYGIKRN